MNITEEGRKRIIAGANKANDIMRKRRIDDYSHNVNHCLFCGEDLPYDKRNNKFCDHTCSASYNNQQREKKKHYCVVCGAETGSKYCSVECQNDTKWSKNRSLIEQGKVSNRPTLKRYVIERDGYKCSICGITEWGRIPVVLILDHIDGNSSHNLPINLRCVCSNCDANLPTYKSKNRNSARSYRRKVAAIA